jgi:hypothetical protein
MPEEDVSRNRFVPAVALSLALVSLGAACGGDDGADVRNIGDGCEGSASSGSGASGSGAGASGSASGCASGSGSASGIAGDVEGSSSDNPLVQDAVVAYTPTWPSRST